ncbi:hypothetical protein [Microbacterium elymi]|uniref:Glycosyltransferase n=1 Tax=Microbacterium elymi TaxID=2909587 RepID=A0ABY5NHC6_9MICO|nr:hypothetical protein [Microbacterium elymi]UUT34491.1 hypothetical protein L2X98_28480 [Microbacterium elymi]
MNPGTIIIAAHNEESVLGRTLDALAELREDDSVRVIVVCNGLHRWDGGARRLAHGGAGGRARRRIQGRRPSGG